MNECIFNGPIVALSPSPAPSPSVAVTTSPTVYPLPPEVIASCVIFPFWTVAVPLAFWPNPVTVVSGMLTKSAYDVLPLGTELPNGVYPIPALVTVNPVWPAPVLVPPTIASDPANPTKVPFGTLSKLIALLFAWNTVLPATNNPIPMVLIPELTNVWPKPTLTLFGLNVIPLSGKSSSFCGNLGL